jgi:PAS domain S-box-containing protein
MTEQSDARNGHMTSFPLYNPNPVLEIDKAGNVLYANPAAENVLVQLGFSRSDTALFLPSGMQELNLSSPVSREVFIKDKIFDESISFVPEYNVIRIYARDVTQRKLMEEKLQQNIRTLRAISNSSQALMRATEEKSFLQEVCTIIVEDCGHAMVWIGYAEDDEQKSVRPVASAGFDEGYLETLKLTWADTERGRGPTGTAIRTGKISICHNMLADPKFRPWREQALKRGYASSIVFPMMGDDGKALGALTIYSKSPDPFSEDEIMLLSELVNDITYGIKMLRLKASKEKAEDALRESEERLNFAMETSNSGAWDMDLESNAVVRSQMHDKIYGYSEMLPEWSYDVFLSHVLPEDRVMVDTVFKRAIQAKSSWSFEYRIKRPDGEIRWLWSAGRHKFDTQGIAHRIIGITQDITERKNVEESLSETRNYLESLFDYANAPIIVWDPDFKITRFNHAFENMTGYRAGEIVGKKLSVLFPPESRRTSLINIISTTTGEHLESIEIPILRKDGSTRIALWNSANIHDRAGKIASTIAQGQDITERKKAEEALRESEERFKVVASSTPDHLLVQDLNLRYTMVINPQLDLTEKDMIGKTDYDILAKEDAENLTRIKRNVLDTKKSMHLEMPLISASGETQYFEGTYVPKYDVGGQADGLIGYFKNITERKKAENALLESEERFKAIAETTSVGIGVIGIPESKFLYINPAYEKAFGYAESDLLGKTTPLIYWNQEDREQLLKTLKEKGSVTEYEVKLRRKDGTPFWGLSSVRPITFGGRKALLGAFVDITDRKKTEEELYTLVKDKETLLREVYHRVKNNLQIIYSLMSMQSRRTENKYIKSALEDGKSRIKSMALINEILYKSENISNLDVNRYLNELVAYLREAYKDPAKDIKIVVDIDSLMLGLDEAVSCGLIVNELVTNSLKYAFQKKNEGTLDIKIKKIDSTAELIIADDGTGLPEGLDVQKTKSLGLQLVSSLTKQLEGTMEIKSENGVKYRICFPLKK